MADKPADLSATCNARTIHFLLSEKLFTRLGWEPGKTRVIIDANADTISIQQVQLGGLLTIEKWRKLRLNVSHGDGAIFAKFDGRIDLRPRVFRAPSPSFGDMVLKFKFAPRLEAFRRNREKK